MNKPAPHDEQKLREELALAQERLDGLVRDLRSVEDELEALAPEQHRYRLLEQVCASLEALDEVGAADLFWSGHAPNGTAQSHLRSVRGRIDAFQKSIDEIEVRHQAILEELEQAEVAAEYLEEDVFEAEREAEARRNEWVIERDIEDLPIHAPMMPWTRGGEDDQRFRKNLGIALLLSLSLAVIFPMIDLPIPDPWKVDEVPERLTSLIKQEIKLPPPPVVEETKPEEPEPEEPVEEKVAEETKPTPQKTDRPAKKTAASKGILAFREKFSSLADSAPAARLGSMAKIDDAGAAATGGPERSMVTTNAPGSSGGINLARLSRDTGGGGEGIGGVAIARATSSIGGGGGTSDRPLAGGPALGRTDEEIQIVFDRHKAALYRLYNRELRRDPTLRGQMVLRLTIQPDGSVSLCRVQSTDMKAPQLASQVVERVKTFDFGAKDVPAVTILYPIDFLPAT